MTSMRRCSNWRILLALAATVATIPLAVSHPVAGAWSLLLVACPLAMLWLFTGILHMQGTTDAALARLVATTAATAPPRPGAPMRPPIG